MLIYDGINPKKYIYMLIECSRPPLRFSFYSFFFLFSFSINEKLCFKELIIASEYRNISEILLEQPASQWHIVKHIIFIIGQHFKFVYERMKHGRHLIALTFERENLVHLVGVDSLSFFPQTPSFCLLNSRLKMGCVYNCEIY